MQEERQPSIQLHMSVLKVAGWTFTEAADRKQAIFGGRTTCDDILMKRGAVSGSGYDHSYQSHKVMFGEQYRSSFNFNERHNSRLMVPMTRI